MFNFNCKYLCNYKNIVFFFSYSQVFKCKWGIKKDWGYIPEELLQEIKKHTEKQTFSEAYRTKLIHPVLESHSACDGGFKYGHLCQMQIWC